MIFWEPRRLQKSMRDCAKALSPLHLAVLRYAVAQYTTSPELFSLDDEYLKNPLMLLEKCYQYCGDKAVLWGLHTALQIVDNDVNRFVCYHQTRLRGVGDHSGTDTSSDIA